MLKRMFIAVILMLVVFPVSVHANNWKWINSDERYSEYIDVDSITPNNADSLPKVVSAWVKVEDTVQKRRYIAKLELNYANRLITLKTGRIDDMVAKDTIGNLQERLYPVTSRDLMTYGDFFWYVKDSYTHKNELEESKNTAKRFLAAASSKNKDRSFSEYIDTMSIRSNGEVIRFEVLGFDRDARGNEIATIPAIVQYTIDGKLCNRYKIGWVRFPGKGFRVAGRNEKFKEVFPESVSQDEFKVLMKYIAEHPEKVNYDLGSVYVMSDY